MRQKPCECCGVGINMSRKRFLDAVKYRKPVLCEQCRRYVSAGVARVSQLPAEQVDPALGLTRKRRGRDSKGGPLEKCPLRRCVRTT